MADDTERDTNFKADQGIVPKHGNGRLMPFRPGTSGNPGGRGSDYHTARQICREATAKAAQKAVELLDDPDPRVALVALNFIWDRAYGRPGPERPEQEDKGHPRPDFSRLSVEERKIFLKILSKLGGEPVRREPNKDEDHGTD